MKKCQPRSLTPFLDGELTEDAWQETEEHLQSCPSCSAQLDELTAAFQHVRGMGRAHVPQEALRAAIEVIAPRAGLTPEAMLAETTEIARAQPAVPPVPPLPGILGPSAPVSDDQAWTPAPTERAAAEVFEPKAEVVEPEAEVVKPEAEVVEPEAEALAPEAEALEPEAGIPETAADVGGLVLGFETRSDASWVPPDPEPSPTWVQPEPWAQPVAPEPDAAVPDAPAPAAPAAEAPEPAAVVAPPEPAAEFMPALEEHPPAPPGLIVPAWMDDLPGSKTQLELEGRQAVDEAIGAPATDAPETEAAADHVMAPPMGPTSAAEAELRALAEDPSGIDSGGDTEPSQLRSRWSWLGALLRRGAHDHTADPGPVAVSEIDQEPVPTAAGPPAPDAAGPPAPDAAEPPAPDAAGPPAPDAAGPPAPDATEPAAPDAAESLAEPLDAADAEPVDRPEAERLMWIAPRKTAETVSPEEAAAAPASTEFEAELDDDEDFSNLSGYREALLGARQEPAPKRAPLALPPELGIRVALGAALVVIVVAAAVLFVGRSVHPSSTAATGPSSNQTTPGGLATASSIPSPAPSTATGPAVGQLTAVVSAGAGGTGWTVSRIRLGSPGSGVTRVVLDISGSGPTPTAQLGRGADGALYLVVPGLSITPSMVSSAAPFGVITGISQAGADGTSLRFTTSGSPGFSVGYLPSPYRLVVDFK